MNKISRKDFIKDMSYITLGMIAFSNMLFAAEKGLSQLFQAPGIVSDPNGILRLMKGFKYGSILLSLICNM